MRRRAGALYIKNKQLFLICEDQQGFYWTPGGGLENDESFEQALERELLEELNAQPLSARLYLSINDTDANEEVQYFLVDMKLPENLPSDVGYHWYTKQGHKLNSIKITQRVYTKVYPRLIADNLV